MKKRLLNQRKSASKRVIKKVEHSEIVRRRRQR